MRYISRKPSAERRRGEHSTWYNDEPITDLHEALDLLWLERNSVRERYLQIHNSLADPSKPEIHADWYTEGDSGGDMSGWYYFQIDPELAKQLQKEELVEPRKVLYMGGFYLEHEKLVLSGKGKEKRERLNREKKEAAIKLMRPGVYEKLQPLYDERRVFPEREHFLSFGSGYGRLAFTFYMLNGDEVYIFPDTGETEIEFAKVEGKKVAGA